jgi:type IV secretory pathway TrbF-like protein
MNDAEFNEAKQLYLEKYGDAIVTNNYLKIFGALLCLAVLGLVVLNLRTIRTFQSFRPLVIRIDDLGRAQAVDYKSLEYRPGDREAKYFLSQFCSLYYRRNRYTIHDDFTKALYFLDGKVANDIMGQYKRDDTINTFLTNPSSPAVDIDVEKVALQPMQAPPYRASVDFYRVEYAPADHSVLKKTLYTANFIFLFKDACQTN